jgi:hypothetical protein
MLPRRGPAMQRQRFARLLLSADRLTVLVLGTPLVRPPGAQADTSPSPLAEFPTHMTPHLWEAGAQCPNQHRVT